MADNNTDDDPGTPVSLVCPLPRVVQFIPMGAEPAPDIQIPGVQMAPQVHMTKIQTAMHEIRQRMDDTNQFYCIWCLQSGPVALWADYLSTWARMSEKSTMNEIQNIVKKGHGPQQAPQE